MRIGIDITALPQKPVGAGVYIIELVRALVALETPHEWILFAHPSGAQLIDIPGHPALTWHIATEKPPALRLLWEQTTLPLLAKQTRLDILHSPHYTRPLFLPCTSVVTFHDMTFFMFPELHTRAKRIFFPAAIHLSAHLADALISVSENTRQDAMRLLHIPARKIHTAPNGVSHNFRPITDQRQRQVCQRKYNLPNEFFLFVGKIEPRKNLASLLKAYRQLLDGQIGNDIPALVLAGEPGWMYDEVYQLIEHLELKERVVLTGYIAAEDLPIVYNLAKVFVYPSIYEGFGLPTLEAMACGTPVITSRTSAMADYVGEAGILVPPHDPTALANAMRTLLQDAALRRQLSQTGLSQASRFTWQNTAQATLQVYETISSTDSRR